ncbi:S1 family peptidase [Streptomyces triculaminicus]|uniref:S1 family peptidase n=1 Tax=Streptomyces triculaminicus TaxID=2816232 RepID=UPI0033F0DF39
MPSRRPRTAWIAAFLLSAAVSTFIDAPAQAVSGQPVNDSFAFTAKLDIGGERACSGALVSPQWLVTAASCFAENPAQGAKVPAGAPKLKTTATIGRADLSRETGTVAEVTELVPRDDRDVVMAKLAKPITGVTPANVSLNAPVEGQDVWVSGYGRTKTEWVPDRLHYAKFTMGAVKPTTIDLTAKSEGAAICQGDTGGPAFRDIGGRYELVGVNSRSWQGGCLGTDEKETRTGAVDTRVDDLAGWIQTVSTRDTLRGRNWADAQHMVPGYFTGGSPGGSRHMDLFVVWKNGSASLFQGADNNDPKYPFSAEHKIAGSGWLTAVSVAGGNFTGSGADGLVVRWRSGEVTWFSHVDQNGFSKEEQLRPANDTWVKYAKLMTVGKFTDNAQRDDLLVVWVDGSISLFTDLGTNGLKREVQLQKAKVGGTYIEQISSGDFTGNSNSDLLVRWINGGASIFPDVTTAGGFSNEIRFREEKSPWRNSLSITGGAFSANDRPNDILVRWSDGNVSLYPAVDAAGTHGEVDLLK